MASAARSGPSQEKIRSDAVVEYVPGDGFLDIQLESRVEYLYGDSLRRLVSDAAARLGVSSGKLIVRDFGALEWILLARIEACLAKAGFGGELLPSVSGSRPPKAKMRLRRSRLYIPGNQPKLMLSAGLYGADGIILDLEDSVPPSEKEDARLLVRNALIALDFGDSEPMVRINQGELGLADIQALVPASPHMVLIPKVERPEQVKAVADMFRQLSDDPPYLMPIIESPAGVMRAYEIATADELVAALTLGLEDLSAELGAPRTPEGWESFLARQTVVYAARAAGIQPIASVFSDIDDMEGLSEYVRRERALGFDGVGCIHPRQIKVVHEAMAPTEKEIDKALRIVKAAKEAEEKGLGVVAVGSKMVDPPVVEQAKRTVQLAVAAGLLEREEVEE